MRGKCQFQYQRDLGGQIPSCEGCQSLPIEAGDSLFSMCRECGLVQGSETVSIYPVESNHCDFFFLLLSVRWYMKLGD